MNRRELMCSAFAGGSLACGFAAGVYVKGEGPTVMPDPMADLAAAYTHANDVLNASDIDDEEGLAAFCAIHIDPLRNRILAKAPIPTTMAGALAAARLAEHSASQGDYLLADPLISVVRQFLEGRA